MRNLEFKDILTDEEIDKRIEKLASENWKVKKIIEDSYNGKIAGIIHEWHPNSKKSLMKMIKIKEVHPGIYQAIK